ncbi:MAG: P-II family nitrogen regulator [Sedimentisphaerales bacterium]|nr:P-II family nitrogen regulator [Sedimentisphaerales bacterium]
MKLVIAYIQPHKLQDVKKALYKAEVHKMSVTNALGCGEQRGYEESYRGVKYEVNLLKKVRIEIAVNEDFMQKTIDAIVEGAHSGTIGDGKIFVLDLVECVRIRTGDKGRAAIG